MLDTAQRAPAPMVADGDGKAETSSRRAASDRPAWTQTGAPKSYNIEHVTAVTHYTDKVFSFRTTRDPAFRFENGQFSMIGLMAQGKPLVRAYSMASANYDDHLDFYSIKVPDGPLTSRLLEIQPGDEILIGRKPTGTLVLGNLLPGRRLFLLATGTGFAPFASLLRDPEIYDKFEQVVVVMGGRRVDELQYATQTITEIREHEYLGEEAAEKLIYYATVTREPFHNRGRITKLISSGRLFSDLGAPALDSAQDRAMICGNPNMLIDMRDMLTGQGFREGSSGEPGSYVIEKAFAER